MFNPNNERGTRNANTAGTTTGTAAAAANQPLSYGQSAASGPAPTTAGPHRHDILNKLDPRVDSTHDRQPMAQTRSGVPEGTYGPHRSRLANALDPRVDSDLDSTWAGAGMGAGGGLGGGEAVPASAAATGAGAGVMGGAAGAARGRGVPVAERTYGPHSSRLANALDPRVDSDRDRHVGPGATHAPGAAAAGTAGAGYGAARTSAGAGGVAGTQTAGPHRSNLMNKLDPRVDSTTGAWKGGAGPGGAI
ncbi:uncharacterized protein THITE_136342 [Thermothielavioides terrestris NRRL 8126]|uniref:Uncharacterized protein n=1 Tax=Thermothielavioides terrestris (strain ATCC 38088 / NRRL 8126) TaxID=578455 RepID=G2R5L8_THETT|nr:uncharacterized protein THITE_136342 [Thermothielavioides terrestris NRRL 8126]AEO68310.1 hypothetical protein THITE_136342 [Thermothielavioides terrestris NRRL 8126]